MVTKKAKTKPKVFVDSSVLIAASISSKGSSQDLLYQGLQGLVEVKDAPIVAGAVKAKADYLVSYDRKHLLQYKQEIKENFKLKVVTPDELIN